MKETFEVSNAFIQYATRLGHKILFKTVLFEKEYVWMQDHEGTIYLEPLF